MSAYQALIEIGGGKPVKKETVRTRIMESIPAEKAYRTTMIKQKNENCVYRDPVYSGRLRLASCRIYNAIRDGKIYEIDGMLYPNGGTK